MSIEPTNSPSNLPMVRRGPINPPVVYARGPAAPGADLGNILSPMFFLWVFKQWWKIGIPAGVILAIVVGASVVSSFVPKYEAHGLLMIEDIRPSIIFPDGVTSNYRFIQTQLELLRSRVVLEPLLSEPKIAGAGDLGGQVDRVSHIQQRLSVRPQGTSELYNISYVCPSPQFAADLVNAVMAKYIDMQKVEESSRTTEVLELLKKEEIRQKEAVERLRKRVVQLAEDATGKDPYTHRPADMKHGASQVANLSHDLVKIEVDRTVLDAREQVLKEEEASGKDRLEPTGYIRLQVDGLPGVQRLSEQIAAAQEDLEIMQEKAIRVANDPKIETDPKFIAKQGFLVRLKAELEKAREKGRETILAERKEKRDLERAEERAEIKKELTALDLRHKYLSDKYEDELKEMKAGGGKSVELEFAKAELSRVDKVFEMISSRSIALTTEMRAPARVTLKQSAVPPLVPMEKTPFKLLLMVCSVAFVVPFALAVAREATVRRINDVVQLAHESRLRVMGEISALPVRYVAASPRNLLPGLRRASYIFAESINSLRTNLAMASEPNDRQVLAVTSSSPGEGKTSVATSLAMSIADTTGARTLIIDGDMRSPDVATMLKTPNRPGLFEVLSGTCGVEEAIHQVGEGNLYVMPAGRATRNPHQVLKLEETKRLLDQLRNRFSSIIIDTPPILGASESLVLAKSADMAIFCSLCDVSRAKQVHIAVERLEHAGVNVAGAVLSGTSTARYTSVYGYYANRGDLSG